MEQRKLNHPHFHNAYFEVLVRFGLLGVIDFCLMVWLIIQSVWKPYVKGDMSAEMFNFIVASLAMLATWCLSSFYVMTTKG